MYMSMKIAVLQMHIALQMPLFIPIDQHIWYKYKYKYAYESKISKWKTTNTFSKTEMKHVEKRVQTLVFWMS
jgi:hypothetical protein